MLISGLWKLAAMAGVIGVGLVAVYQAHQGLDQSPLAATSPDEASDTRGLAADAVREPAALTPTPLETDPLKLDNPFAELPTRTASVKPQQFVEATDAPEPFDRLASPAAQPLIDFTEDAAAASDKLSGPGLDFRNDTANSGPELGRTTPTPVVQQTGFDDAQPGRLPDAADPFTETPETATPSAATSAQPFVRRANEEKSDPALKPATKAADPFLDAAPPGFSTKPASTEPIPSATVTEPATEADPFAEPPPPISVPVRSEPVRNEPESDPFSGAPPSTSPTDAPVPSLDTPAAIERAEEKPEKSIEKAAPLDSADPFSNPATAPPDLAPSETRPAASIRAPLGSTANPLAPRGRTSMPRLPTEVPSPTEPMGYLDPLPGNREPLRDRRTPEPPQSPTADDLAGDGTVTDATPRGIQQPRITIEKIAPQQCVLGEPLIYSVIVKNVGGSEAHHVVVEDRIPKGTELTGTSPRAEMVDKRLIWRIGTMKPNEEKKISIRVIPRQEGPIGSVARVNFSAEVAAEIMVAAPQLSFKVNAPREVRIGETIDLTFQLKNSGGAAANNVSVRDLIPEGLKHEAAADIECPIGKLGPNEAREIVLQVTAIKPGRVKNRAILTADGGITQELESTIDVIGEHLVLTRSGQNRIYAERPAVFINSVKNEGNAPVSRVKVSEIVPGGLEFVEASDGGQFDPVERAIHWTVGPLAPGAETAVSAKLIAKTPGSQLGKISATGSAGSAASVKSEVDVIGRPELQMETVNATGQVAVGDRLTSKIQLKNSGSAPARNVGLSISIPREMKLIEVRGGRYQAKNNVVQFEHLSELAPRDVAAFEVVMEAIAEADAKMDLQITADHLTKPARRTETVQIANEVR
jgi:uncharacterized repeat protein (TIGR01451 family)